MRVPNAVHQEHPWLISEIAVDLELLDAWALPVEGGRDDFPLFLDAIGSFDPLQDGPWPARFLFHVRLYLGRLLRLDDSTEERRIPGSRETTLSSRVPAHLRATINDLPLSRTLIGAGARPLYAAEDEAALEISNGTVHGVLHLGWVEQEDGRFRGRLGIYVKPRGLLGRLYVASITPFRYLIVYPGMIRTIGRLWEERLALR
jgi:hypothetical protein